MRIAECSFQNSFPIHLNPLIRLVCSSVASFVFVLSDSELNKNCNKHKNGATKWFISGNEGDDDDDDDMYLSSVDGIKFMTVN